MRNMVSLKDVVRFHYGSALKAEDRDDSGPFTVFGSNGPVGRHSLQLVDFPTIIVGRKGSVGSVYYAEEGGWPIDTTYYTEIIDKRHLHIRYLYYALFQAGLDRHTIVTSIPGLNRDALYRTTIPLPPLPEQKRIADILDKADAIRRKRHQAVDLVTTIPTAAFNDLFGDPVSNPHSWGTQPLSDITLRVTVGIVVKPASYYVDTGIPALRSLNVRTNRVVTENLVYVSSADNEGRLAKTRLWKGDVVLVRSGQPGTAAVVPDSLDGVNAIDLLIVTPNKQLVDSYYLSYLFNSSAGRKLVLGEQRGQIQQHLNVTSLKDLLVPLPPLKKQQEFRLLVEQIAVCQLELRHAGKNASELFSSLVQRAFRGEL